MRDFRDFKLAFDFASDHIVVTDPNGVILYANKAAERITGYSIREMVGQRPSLWGGQMQESFYKNFWKRIKSGKVFSGEINNRRKSGVYYEAEVHVTPVMTPRGKIKFFVAVERDITEEKRIQKVKTEFVALVSHQLQSPLVIMKWYLEMLLSEEPKRLSHSQKKYIREIQSATFRMKSLVDSLLEVSRIDMGVVFQDLALIDPKKILKEVLESKQIEAKRKDLHFRIRISSTVKPMMLDSRFLNVVYDNILNNAIQYSLPKGCIDVELSEVRTGKKHNLLLKIQDTGLGIPEAQQSKIFDKFFRADNAESKVPHGNGFGLYIVRALVERMKGKIWFRSKLGQGSTFWVRLPIKK